MTGRTAALRLAAVAAAFLAVYVVAIRTEAGQRIDAESFAAVDDLNQGWGGLAGRIREDLLIPVAAFVFLLALVALAQRRIRDCASATALVAVSVLLTQALKTSILDRPDLGSFGYAYNTFPSGHTAAFGSLFLAVYVLAPERLRTTGLALGLGLLATVGGVSSVVAFAHRPSDVVGGFLIVAAVMVGCSFLAGSDLSMRWSRRMKALTLAGAGGSVALFALDTGDLLAGRLGTVAGNLAPLAMIGAAALIGYLVLDDRRAAEISMASDQAA